MRPRCGSHGSGGSEPVLAGPAHAVSIIRASTGPSRAPGLVVLLCDADHHLLLAITAEGAPPSAAPRVVDLVLAVAETAGVAGIVVGVVRERLGQYLPKPDVAALHGLAARCEAGGVALLDLLLVGPRGWRSLYDLAAVRPEDEDGP